MKTLAIDIETYSSIDLKKAGLYRYVQAPDFAILLFAYSVDGGPVEVVDFAKGEKLTVAIADALFDYDVLKTAWNASFERTCISAHFQGAEMDPEQWECTMARAAHLGLPLSLDAAAKVLGVAQKGEGKPLIKYFSQPCKPTKVNGGRTRNLPEHAPEKWAEFVEYCRQDVVVEQAIRAKVDFFQQPEWERRLWCLDQRINDRGVLADPALIESAIRIDAAYRAQLTTEALELTGLENPNSAAQLKTWLAYEIGVDEVATLRKGDIPDLLEQAPTQEVERVLQIRQEMAKTSVKKYAAMQHGLGADNRIRGLLQYYGANRTGRWAGRLVQVQNLPRNEMRDLDLARGLVRAGQGDLLALLFDSTPDVLSQLIRTAFVAPDSGRFIVADFSAIEARVIAWLAGEQWRLDVFRTHGKIYEASAAQMFKVPLESVTKGSPLRQKGKIAELALGYQGGEGALVQMGALAMGLQLEELQPLVNAWRAANRAIVNLWYRVQDAAINAVADGPTAIRIAGTKAEVSFRMEKGTLFCTLPSGRRLSYLRAKLAEGHYGPELRYEGMDQKTGKWGRISTYGGKLVENCLAGDTLVLTGSGWKQLATITTKDQVWDGRAWVRHNGLLCQGTQLTITLDGVRMTPEHKILTSKGWRYASSCERYYRNEVALPDGCSIPRIEWQEIALGSKVRLRKAHNHAGIRISKGEAAVLRMSARGADRREAGYACYVETSGFCCMGVHESPLQQSEAPGLGQLRRPRYTRMRAMAGEFRELLGRHGAGLRARAFTGPYRRQRGVYAGKLSVGYHEKARPQQTQQHRDRHTVGAHYGGRGRRAFGHRRDNAPVPTQHQLLARRFIRAAGRTEPVYDLLNAGPLSRFTVLGAQGPFIVHNCVQAIARDCLAWALLNLDDAGYCIVCHVHDEVIIEDDYTGSLEDVDRIMSTPIPWAPGLPLTADSYETTYYKKD